MGESEDAPLATGQRTEPGTHPPADVTDPRQRKAWQALADGGSLVEAATLAGCSKRSISNWLRAWREIHGETLFRAERSAELERWATDVGTARDAKAATAQLALLERLERNAIALADAVHDGATGQTDDTFSQRARACRDLTVALGITAEKVLLLSGQPTARSVQITTESPLDRSRRLSAEFGETLFDQLVTSVRRASATEAHAYRLPAASDPTEPLSDDLSDSDPNPAPTTPTEDLAPHIAP